MFLSSFDSADCSELSFLFEDMFFSFNRFYFFTEILIENLIGNFFNLKFLISIERFY